jgi:tRNA1(Val) A37 N6-methylase TrmN6
MKMDEWAGCYQDGWKGIITEESFAHPAKVSYSLAERIYKHLAEKGWIERGTRILDPFGGIGGFALHAMLRGCHFTGCELEEKFVLLARENIRRWAHQYRNWPGIGSAVMLHGDSRRLSACIAQAGLQEMLANNISTDVSTGVALSCQTNTICENGNQDITPRLFDAIASSPPFLDARSATTPSRKGNTPTDHDPEAWGTTPGQLGAMKEGSIDAVVSSPPYASGTVHNNGQDAVEIRKRAPTKHGWGLSVHAGFMAASYGTTPGQLGALPEGAFDAVVSSPPYAGSLSTVNPDIEAKLQAAKNSGQTAHRATWGANKGSAGWSGDIYGQTPGQLGAMKEGAFDAVVSSPPFQAGEHIQQSTGIAAQARKGRKSGSDIPYVSPGQLGTMKEGTFDAVVSSPPYEGTEIVMKKDPAKQMASLKKAVENGAKVHRDFLRKVEKGWSPHDNCGTNGDSEYGKAEGQLGNSTGSTFWSASKDIVQQCYDMLAPCGHAVWVVKSFVRKGKIVDFPGQWRTLCESVGFITLHEHHAMLVEETEHDTLFNGKETKKVERKSFFRRLHEAKSPHTAINWETVFCMVKG